MRLFPTFALLLIATVANAQTTSLHCPSGCLPNAGPPAVLSPTGLLVPAQCACNWDTQIVTDLNILNSSPGGTTIIPAVSPNHNDSTQAPGTFPANDSAVAINTAINALIPGSNTIPFTNGPDGGTVHLPAGIYYAKCPAGGLPAIQFKSANGIYSGSGRGLVIEGEGQGATLIVTDTTLPGCSVFGSATPKTCDSNSGTGSCDAAPAYTGHSTRGVGCPCYDNSDCGGTGTCTGGRVSRNVTIRDLAVTVQKDNMTGFDMAFCSTCKLERVTFDVSSSLSSHVNVTGVRFSDGSQATGTLGCYDNSIMSSNIASADICIRAMKQSNDLRIFNNIIGNTCGTGLVTEGTETVHVSSNLFQSTRSPTCSGGTTCLGGYHNGKACAVATDCAEADIIDGGFLSTGSQGNVFTMNHIEDSNNPHILLGDGAGTSQSPTVFANAHFGSGKCVTNKTVSGQPYVVEPNCPAADLTTMLPQPQTEPLPTCASTSGPMMVRDLTLANKNWCFCDPGTAKWCRVDSPATCNTATAC